MNYIINDDTTEVKVYPFKILSVYKGHEKVPDTVVKKLQQSFDETGRFMLRKFERCEIEIGIVSTNDNYNIKIIPEYNLFLSRGVNVKFNIDDESYVIKATLLNTHEYLVEINKNVCIGKIIVNKI